MRYFIIFFLSLLLTACQNDLSSLEINMYNADGDMVGTAHLSENPDGVKIKLKMEGVSPGFHGIHIHEYAKCEGPDFTSAGNHLNPEGKKHGLMHPEGAHLGDIVNVEADSGGLIDTEVTVQGATLKEGKKSLVKGEGTSLIITENQDDGISQPGGNSGQRLVCGVITINDEEDSREDPTDPTMIHKKDE